MKAHKNCQSCGMPMTKDSQKGGTNSDGSKNRMFCSYCYQDGNFSNPNMTVNEMQELVVVKLKEMKFPGFIARFFAKGIPKLERWK